MPTAGLRNRRGARRGVAVTAAVTAAVLVGVGCTSGTPTATTSASAVADSAGTTALPATSAPASTAAPTTESTTTTTPAPPPTEPAADHTLTVTSPGAGAVYGAGDPVQVEAVLEPPGTITQAILLVDGEPAALGPYPSLRWEAASPGDHDLSITVEVEGAGTFRTAPIRIHVNDPPPPPTAPPPPPPQPAPAPVLPPGTFWATVTSDVNVRYHPDVTADAVDFLGAGTVVPVRCWVYGGEYELGGSYDAFWARVVIPQGEDWVADGFLNTSRNESGYPDYPEC